MFVEVRRRVWPAFERLGKTILPEDVAVPRQHLAELLNRINEIGRVNGITIPTMGHAGDGNLHPLLVFDPNDTDERTRVRGAFEEIMQAALELGGTISAEHGVGTLKRALLAKELDPSHLDVQRRIKAILDPSNMMNPGKSIGSE